MKPKELFQEAWGIYIKRTSVEEPPSNFKAILLSITSLSLKSSMLFKSNKLEFLVDCFESLVSRNRISDVVQPEYDSTILKLISHNLRYVDDAGSNTVIEVADNILKGISHQRNNLLLNYLIDGDNRWKDWKIPLAEFLNSLLVYSLIIDGKTNVEDIEEYLLKSINSGNARFVVNTGNITEVSYSAIVFNHIVDNISELKTLRTTLQLLYGGGNI